MPISISQTRRWNLKTRGISRAARKTLELEGAKEAEVAVLLTDDSTIQSMNRQHRGYDKPTDVLSFAQRDSGVGIPIPMQPEILGDVVVSVDTASRQAEVFGVPVENEIALLVVHGILHLLGHDDETEDGANQMRVREQRVLEAAGIGHHRMASEW